MHFPQPILRLCGSSYRNGNCPDYPAEESRVSRQPLFMAPGTKFVKTLELAGDMATTLFTAASPSARAREAV